MAKGKNNLEEVSKKEVKLNNKAKSKKIKEIKYKSEEQQEITRFIIILVVIFVIVGVVYGVSKIFIKEENESNTPTSVPGTINYDLVTVGTMFNRPMDEYYVALYNSSDTQAVLYSSIINVYTNKTDSKKVYFCDLDNKLNIDYISKDGKNNVNAKTIDELSLGSFSFVKIKNGKIVSYFETVEDMKKELSV